MDQIRTDIITQHKQLVEHLELTYTKHINKLLNQKTQILVELQYYFYEQLNKFNQINQSILLKNHGKKTIKNGSASPLIIDNNDNSSSNLIEEVNPPTSSNNFNLATPQLETNSVKKKHLGEINKLYPIIATSPTSFKGNQNDIINPVIKSKKKEKIKTNTKKLDKINKNTISTKKIKKNKNKIESKHESNKKTKTKTNTAHKQRAVITNINKKNTKKRTNKRMQKCKFCGYSTNDSMDFIKHLKVHSRSTSSDIDEICIKPHKCSYNGCTRAFKLKGNLKVHLRIHTGEKPYECDACQKKFAQSSGLRYHVIKHHPD